MTLKRMLALASIMALAAMAVPALAQGAVWKHNGSNLSKFVEFGLEGGELFETTSGNGMNCAVHATMTTEGGSEAEITSWEIEECPKAFGSFSGCTVKTAEAKELPWPVEVNAADLTIVGMHVKRTFNGGCAEVNKTIEETTVTLNAPSAITEMEFEGETTGYKTNGSFAVEGANSGTYGIG